MSFYAGRKVGTFLDGSRKGAKSRRLVARRGLALALAAATAFGGGRGWADPAPSDLVWKNPTDDAAPVKASSAGLSQPASGGGLRWRTQTAPAARPTGGSQRTSDSPPPASDVPHDARQSGLDAARSAPVDDQQRATDAPGRRARVHVYEGPVRRPIEPAAEPQRPIDTAAQSRRPIDIAAEPQRRFDPAAAEDRRPSEPFAASPVGTPNRDRRPAQPAPRWDIAPERAAAPDAPEPASAEEAGPLRMIVGRAAAVAPDIAPLPANDLLSDELVDNKLAGNKLADNKLADNEPVGSAVAEEEQFVATPISNAETRARTRAQVLGITQAQFVVDEPDDPSADRYVAQQAPNRPRRDPFGSEPSAPERGSPPDGAAPPGPAPFGLPPDMSLPNLTPPGPLPDPLAPANPVAPNVPGDMGLDRSPSPSDLGDPSQGLAPTTQPIPCEKDKAACGFALDKLQANTVDHIALNIRVNGSEGIDFPCECTLGHEQFRWRHWGPTCYTFKANAQCHKPLYFEDVQLERYGHSWNPIVQDVLSGAHFYLNLLLLPYHMGIYPPNECIYTMGYYRPGSCAPFVIEPEALSARGLLFETSAIFTGAWLWGFFAP